MQYVVCITYGGCRGHGTPHHFGCYMLETQAPCQACRGARPCGRDRALAPSAVDTPLGRASRGAGARGLLIAGSLGRHAVRGPLGGVALPGRSPLWAPGEVLRIPGVGSPSSRMARPAGDAIWLPRHWCCRVRPASPGRASACMASSTWPSVGGRVLTRVRTGVRVGEPLLPPRVFEYLASGSSTHALRPPRPLRAIPLQRRCAWSCMTVLEALYTATGRRTSLQSWRAGTRLRHPGTPDPSAGLAICRLRSYCCRPCTSGGSST